MNIEAALEGARIIPVVTIERIDDAVPVAAALLRGGLRVIEIVLRTECAAAAIRAVSDALPVAFVGAGTVTSADQVAAATGAGARFLVSPGITPALLDAMTASGLPILPGVATASEALQLLERRIHAAKFFPASAIGGPAALAALGNPLPELRFCPTGGIDERTAAGYLALPNVFAVGGSWMVPREAIRARDWKQIETLAGRAAGV